MLHSPTGAHEDDPQEPPPGYRLPTPVGDGVVVAEFACASCGSHAAALALVPPGTHTAFGWGFPLDAEIGRAERWSLWYDALATGLSAVEPTHIDEVRGALGRRDSVSLFRLAGPIMTFYCPDCEAWYCQTHWTLETVMADDPPGWYDCTYGTCPRGHRRMLDD